MVTDRTLFDKSFIEKMQKYRNQNSRVMENLFLYMQITSAQLISAMIVFLI